MNLFKVWLNHTESIKIVSSKIHKENEWIVLHLADTTSMLITNNESYQEHGTQTNV